MPISPTTCLGTLIDCRVLSCSTFTFKAFEFWRDCERMFDNGGIYMLRQTEGQSSRRETDCIRHLQIPVVDFIANMRDMWTGIIEEAMTLCLKEDLYPKLLQCTRMSHVVMALGSRVPLQLIVIKISTLEVTSLEVLALYIVLSLTCLCCNATTKAQFCR